MPVSRPAFHRILVLPGVWPSGELLDRLAPLSAQPPEHLTAWPLGTDQFASWHADTDALLAGWKDVLDAMQLKRFPGLRYIGLRATSTHHVDLEHARRHGITVRPIHGYGDTGTGEFVIEQMLVHARCGEGRETPGELAGRRLGLVGYGSVARRVAQAAEGLGMQVAFHTPTRRTAAHGAARWLPLAELLSTSEVLSFHSPAYQHVLTEDDLRRIPPRALVLITTLGLPVAERALAAWQQGRTGHLVMDLCAAHALSADTAHVRGIRIHDRYAARTVESVRRAENLLLEGVAAQLRP